MKLPRSSAFSFAVVVCVLLSGVDAMAAAEAPADRGLKIGTRAPEFKLKDQDGKERALSDFLKNGNVALVFYRSADW